jgi:hypothetical protein
VFQAPQVISTLPVNRLGDVVFTPAIDAKKSAAAELLTKVVKMHTYTKATLKPTLATATGAAKIAFGYTEGDLHGPETGTFSVFFSSETHLDLSSPSATVLDSKKGLKEQFVMGRNTAGDVEEPAEMFRHDWTDEASPDGRIEPRCLGAYREQLFALNPTLFQILLAGHDEREQPGRLAFGNEYLETVQRIAEALPINIQDLVSRLLEQLNTMTVLGLMDAALVTLRSQ